MSFPLSFPHLPGLPLSNSKSTKRLLQKNPADANTIQFLAWLLCPVGLAAFPAAAVQWAHVRAGARAVDKGVVGSEFSGGGEHYLASIERLIY
jgi:hypothetical protein